MLKQCVTFWINREGPTMAFWIFMFVMNMLIPFSMIGFGRYFLKKRQKKFPLLGSIIPVERGVKKTFDKYGNRR